MAKKCLYCGCEISEDSVLDFCEPCGRNAFSEKMLEAIKANFKNKG